MKHLHNVKISLKDFFSITKGKVVSYSEESWQISLQPNDQTLSILDKFISMKMHHLNLINGKHKTNTNWGTFYKITGLDFSNQCINVKKDKEKLKIFPDE